MKNWIDVIFVIASILSFVRGFRAGLVTSLFSFVGVIGGGLLGLTLGLHVLHSHGVTKFILLFLAISIGSSIGEALFKSIGKLFHNKILFGPFKCLDSLLGAAFSVVRTLIMLLIVAHLLLITPWQWANQNIPTSKIYVKLNSLAPSIITDITKRAKDSLT